MTRTITEDVKGQPVTVMGELISVSELFEIIERVQSGETTLAEECAKNLEPAVTK